ncbi:hypothetical protein [Pseudogracilibacillus sp. ICA-222130]|uniref:hypothetical protein n=1 Tax=Pseudogracilibacillus sp. ICA-222130 TaxID=3134655 RepID=UPI0030BF8ED3
MLFLISSYHSTIATIIELSAVSMKAVGPENFHGITTYRTSLDAIATAVRNDIEEETNESR